MFPFLFQGIILFTSGPWPSQYRDTWKLAARQLRQKGVEIYAVGIGSSVDEDQLNDITENTYTGNDLSSITPDLDYDIRTGIQTRVHIFRVQFKITWKQ